MKTLWHTNRLGTHNLRPDETDNGSGDEGDKKPPTTGGSGAAG